MTDSYVHAIWCDDIRQEVGNKPSFMGVYTAGLTIESALPVILQRLCLYVWVVQNTDKPFNSLVLKITRDDGLVLAELRPDMSDIDELITKGNHLNSKHAMLMAGVTINGVEISPTCKYFSITAETEAGILEGPKLHINHGFDPAH